MPYIAILLSIFVTLVVVLAIVLKRWKNEEVKTDYRTFFIFGISWLPLGIVFWIVLDFIIGIPLFVMGSTFLIIGLLNRDKWTEPQPLTAGQRKLTIGLVIGGVFLFLLMLGSFLFIEFFR
jgi:hypothetical protein